MKNVFVLLPCYFAISDSTNYNKYHYTFFLHHPFFFFANYNIRLQIHTNSANSTVDSALFKCPIFESLKLPTTTTQQFEKISPYLVKTISDFHHQSVEQFHCYVNLLIRIILLCHEMLLFRKCYSWD